MAYITKLNQSISVGADNNAIASPPNYRWPPCCNEYNQPSGSTPTI